MSGRALVTELEFPPAGADLDDVREAWRDACADAYLAYAGWRDAQREDAAMAYAVYVAAADREAVAAEVLERWERDEPRATAIGRGSRGEP
jgi:hypothetical protein